MADYVFPPRPRPVAQVAGTSQQFPINRIHCVGRNYAAHIREMGFDPDREPPFFFQKPSDAYVASGAEIAYPPDTENLQFEIELVAAIGKGGRDIPVDEALDHIWGYAVGVDLTRRDRQLQARDRGRPWEPGKAFDKSAPMAPIVRATECGHLSRGRIWLTVNGATKQDADIGQLVWSVPEIVSTLSRSWELIPGDLIFSGTPEGVGPIQPGDHVEGGVDGLPPISFVISSNAKR